MIRATSSRGGFSLLEVLLAMAILVGTIAVLGELMSIGMNNVEVGRDRARAMVLAEGIMDQMLIGMLTPDAVEEVAIPEELLSPDELEGNWVYTLEVGPPPDQGMLHMTVIVSRLESGRFDGSTEGFRMTRWMIDPATLDEMAAAEDAAAMAAESAATASSTGGAP